MKRYLLAAFVARLADAMWLATVLLVLHPTHSAGTAGLTLAAATLPPPVPAPPAGGGLARAGRRRGAITVPLLVLASARSALAAGAPAVPCAALAGLLQPLVTGGFSSMVPALT